MRHLGEVCFLPYCWRSSWTKLTLSLINLPPKKAFCIGLMILVKAWANQLDNIFKITLYIILQLEIGLKSLVEETFADLGTNAITKWLICFKSFPDRKKSRTTAQKYSPTTPKLVWKRRSNYQPRSFVIPYAENCLSNIFTSYQSKEEIMRTNI
jgi:hypothetical protein